VTGIRQHAEPSRYLVDVLINGVPRTFDLGVHKADDALPILCIEPHNDGFEETFKFVYPSLAIPADIEELVIRFHAIPERAHAVT